MQQKDTLSLEGHWEAFPSLLLPKRKSEVDGLSSFRKAASIAWLKEFWKLGTGTRSELSLSASLSPGAGGARLWFSSGTGTAELSLLGSPLGMEPARHPSAGSYPVEPPPSPHTKVSRLLTFLLWNGRLEPRLRLGFASPQHLPRTRASGT